MHLSNHHNAINFPYEIDAEKHWQLATGKLSACAASTIGSLTCRYYRKYKMQQVNKRKDDRQINFKEKVQERIGNKN